MHAIGSFCQYGHILTRLDRCKPGLKDNSWHACCPVHGDRRPSLVLWIGPDGELVAKCKANKGCTWAAIVEALGTKPADWFPPKEPKGKRRGKVSNIVAEYDYRDERGQVRYQIVRYDPKGFKIRCPAGPGWTWGAGDVELIPYRLPEMLARREQPVIVVEGEKDVDALAALGLVATTSPFGAGKWPLDFGRYLRGRRVAIIPDNDEPGRHHAAVVAGSCLLWGAASIRVVNLGGGEGDDVSDWLSNPLPNVTDAGKRKSLCALIAAATEYRPHMPERKVAA